jgi:hypothetical protein
MMNDQKLQNDDENKIKDILSTVKRTEETKISRAEEVERIIRCTKKYRRTELSLYPIREPLLFLGRRNGTFQTFEGITAGAFDFKHSDGNNRFIIIDPNKQNRLGIGRNSIRFYWAHEDYPNTGYPDPVMTAEQVSLSYEKLLSNIRKWLALDKKATGDMWMKIGLGTAAVILAYFIGKGMFQSTSPQIIYQAAMNLTNATINTTMNLTAGNIPII